MRLFGAYKKCVPMSLKTTFTLHADEPHLPPPLDVNDGPPRLPGLRSYRQVSRLLQREPDGSAPTPPESGPAALVHGAG